MLPKLRNVFLISILAVAASAAEKPQLPKDMPPYGPLKPFAAPKVQQAKLSNGLTVWLVQQAGFPKVAVGVAVRGGLAYDPADRPGEASFLGAVVNQGTKTRSARQIAEEIQSAGGDLGVDVHPDFILVRTEVLSTKTDAALAILADVLQNATLPDDEVELARSNLADSLRGNEADPGFLGARALAKAVFGDHPYGVISPTQGSLAAITAVDLRREFARRFRPDKAMLVAVGDFDPVRLSAAIESAFGKWALPTSEPLPQLSAPPSEAPHALFTIARTGSVQTTLIFGAPGPNRRAADYAGAEVASAIFGGMFGSRMINNIREDKGYSYTPFAFLQTRQLGGIFRTQADVRNPVTGASFNEMVYELNRMATTEPTDDEIATAKRYLVGNKAIALQARDSVASQLASLWVDNLPPEELGLASEKIEKVSAKDVGEVGRKYYSAGRTAVIAVGEKEVIDSQLKMFGLPERPGYAPDAESAPPK